MRWAWLILLAGCYKPGAFCEDGCLTGDGGSDGSSTDSGTADVMPIEACVSKVFGTLPVMPMLSDATSYTTDGAIAIFEEQDAPVVRETTADAPDSGQLIDIDGVSLFTLQRPRLAPDGLELFALGLEVSTDAYQLVRMARVPPKKWSPPAPVVITNAPTNFIDENFVPGVPSATDPRQMVVSRANGGLSLGVEQAGGKWSFADVSAFTNLPGNARDPFLSKDGRALLFVESSGGNIQILRATRPSIEDPFDPPVALVNYTSAGGNELTPALSPDCEKLYWSMDAAPGTFTATN